MLYFGACITTVPPKSTPTNQRKTFVQLYTDKDGKQNITNIDCAERIDGNVGNK